MANNSHIAMIMELQQDLSAHQKELSSKTKKLAQMENIASSMRIEILNKNKVIDELKISSKLSADNRTDEMYLQIEEYKNEINSKESRKLQITNDYNELQRSYQGIKTQFESLSFKYKQQQQVHQQTLNQMDAVYKNKINNLQKIHQNELQKLTELKDKSYLSNNAETQSIQNSLKELKESHERIEADLNTQIEDLKDQMHKRQTEKQQLIAELHQLSTNYKKYASNEIQKLTHQLQRYEHGDVEIVLHIEVDDDYMRNKRPPKKPAPPKPLIVVDSNKHSRRSSNASSTQSHNGQLTLLSPLSPTVSNDNDAQSYQLTIKNVQSNPGFWSADHSNPNAPHHQTFLSQGSMPSMDSNDDDDESGDDDSKESKSDGVIPPPINTNNVSPKTAAFNTEISDTLSKLSVNNGYVSRRKHPRLSHPHIKASKSASSLPMGSSSLSRQAQTPSFYVFRQSLSNKSKNVNDKSYNAVNELISQRYGKHENDLSKYTDSALGFIKNGVVSMWGSNPKSKLTHAQTPGPRSRARYLSSANSHGFPSTYNGIKRNKRTRSNQSSLSSYDLFSDTSSTGCHTLPVPNGTASSVKLSPVDALSNKSLELQRKMLMQANTRLVEDLKNEKKHVMIVKEKAHRKYKQLQIQMQAEHRQWRLKERQLQQKMERQIEELKKEDHNMLELRRKFKALQTDYNMQINNENNKQPVPRGVNSNELVVKVQLLERNNKSLIEQCERYRRELSGLKHTILSCNDTMKQQQNQILILNTSVSELRKLNGFGGGSSEQLLQKQIRLLKSQRRMLIQELKDLRQQNDKLKNIIVCGTASKTYATQ